MIKNLRKGGFSGACARYRLRFALFAIGAIAIASLLCFLSEGAGSILGASLAVMPLIGFKVPEDSGFSESERKSLNVLFGSLSEQFNEQFKSFESGNLTKEDMLSTLNEKLKCWSQENGISKEQFEKMSNALKQQGEMLSSLKEQGGNPRHAGGIKAAFGGVL